MPFDYHSLIDIAFRSVCVYLFMLVAFRVFGKRELSQLSTTDLVLLVLISNSVQNAMVGNNTSLLGGLTAATVLFVVNLFFGFLMFKFKGLKKIIQSEPLTLIYNGKIIDKNLQSTMLTIDELMAAIREHGIERYDEVKLAILEVDGNISVISGSDDDQLKLTNHKRKSHHKSMQVM